MINTLTGRICDCFANSHVTPSAKPFEYNMHVYNVDHRFPSPIGHISVQQCIHTLLVAQEGIQHEGQILGGSRIHRITWP
jgi:hypothetical protein